MIELLEIKKNWKVVKLDEVCDITSSKRIFQHDYVGSGIPFFRTKEIKELSEGKDVSTELFITKEKYNEIKGQFDIPKIGDILISAVGTIGVSYIIKDNEPFYFKDGNLIWIKNLSKVDTKFLNYYLAHFVRFKQTIATSGSAYNALTIVKLKDFEIPLPSQIEQQQIVSKIEELFSELDKGIEELKTAQQQLKVYRQAVLKWAFEGKLTEQWRVQQSELIEANELLKEILADKQKTLGKRAKPLMPITSEEMLSLPQLPQTSMWVKLGDHAFVTKLAGFEFTKYVRYKAEGDVPVIRAQNVSKDSFIPRNFVFVDREIMEQLPRSRVFGGEILMVFVGAGLGNVGIVPEKHEFFLGPNVAKIALEKQFSNKYVFYFLSSSLGFSNVTGMSKATAQGSISMANIREVSVPLMSLEEQQQIVQEIESRLSVCDKIEETITNSLKQSEALRQSILKKAFEGKLVP